MLEMLEQTIHDWALFGATLLDAIAALVVIAAALQAVAREGLALAKPRPAAKLMPLRRRLSEWLAFALELLIASDIMRTAVAPSWVELGRLAAIVVLRVVINYTLMRDVKGE